MSRYLIFGVVGLILLLQTMAGNAVAVAFPQLASSFHASLALAGWVLSIFPLATILTIPLSGKASDALGRKRTLLFSVLLFTIGSFLCAIAPNVYLLILFRAVQGAGAGGFMTSAAGAVADAFPESRQRALGLIVSINTFGMVFGLTVGGWLTESFGWRSIFWFTVPFSVAALIAVAALLKRDKKVEKVDLDMKGASFIAVSLGALMAGLTTIGGTTKASWAMVIGLLALGAVLIVVFLRHEQRVRNPIIDIEILRSRPFMAANVFNVTYGVLQGVLTLLPLFAVTIYGVSTLESGLIVTPRTAGILVSSVISSFTLVRWGYRWPMLVGSSLSIVACLFFGLESRGISLAGVAVSGVTIMLALVAISGLGHGFLAPASNNACIELMPDRVSTITGVRNTCRHAGQALGVAVASIVLSKSASLADGFQLVFFGAALLAAASVPFIFIMPRSPSDVPAGHRMPSSGLDAISGGATSKS